MTIARCVSVALLIVSPWCSAHCWTFAGTFTSDVNWQDERMPMTIRITQSGCVISIEDPTGTLTGTYDLDDREVRAVAPFCGFTEESGAIDPVNYYRFTRLIIQYNAGAFSSECRGSPSLDGKDKGGYLRRIGVGYANTGSSRLYGLSVGIRIFANGVTRLTTREFHRG